MQKYFKAQVNTTIKKMNNNGNNRFLDGFMLGIIVGALGVFLFGTKSGKNLMKILSEEGLEGISKLMQEYNLSDFGKEFEQDEEVEPEPVVKHATTTSNHHSESQPQPQEVVKEVIHDIKQDIQEELEKTPKKRFFKRLRN